jgi:hypothetical protein
MHHTWIVPACTHGSDFPMHSVTQVFFCKYNDPSYVKMEKLDIMMR